MIEYRIAPVEAAGDALRLEGYAARFNVPSLPLMHRGQRVTETIAPTAFDRSLHGGGNISMFWAHDSQEVMANTSSGTLELSTDSVGLRFSAHLPDTQRARDAVALVRAGVISQMSFGFQVREDAMDGTSRTLKDVELLEVSLVERAAYPQTTVASRSVISQLTGRTALRLKKRIEL